MPAYSARKIAVGYCSDRYPQRNGLKNGFQYSRAFLAWAKLD